LSTTVTEEPFPLPRLQPRVLRQEVLGVLRVAILSREIPPGTRLLESEVASRMGISRAPVREAIRQLEQEGLVEFFPHRGAIVIGLPDDEIDAVYELRALVEEKAIARACARAGQADIEQLDRIIEEMRDAHARRDIDELAEADLRFHGAIVTLSGFSLLRHVWSSLDGLVRVRSYQALDRPGRAAEYFLKGSIGSHDELVAAIREGNPDLAAERVRRHILEVPEWLRKDGRRPT
jgi:DNA-binding GntR family transcriptional regulator